MVYRKSGGYNAVIKEKGREVVSAEASGALCELAELIISDAKKRTIHQRKMRDRISTAMVYLEMILRLYGIDNKMIENQKYIVLHKMSKEVSNAKKGV